MNLNIQCPDCGFVKPVHIFDLGPLDDKAKDWIASIVLEEHRKGDCAMVFDEEENMDEPSGDEKCQCGHELRDHAGFAGCAGSKRCKCGGFTPINERRPFNE
jgi:hypothetical protein